MRRLIHLWFDVDDTLYAPSPRLKEIRMQVMYKAIADKLGCSVQEVKEIYDASYALTESHSTVFKEFGLTHTDSRKAYASVNTPKYIRRDERLVALFEKLDKRKLPCSLYSNNLTRMTAQILFKLGLVPRLLEFQSRPLAPPEFWKEGEDEKADGIDLSRFAYVLPAKLFPKGVDSAGFQEIVNRTKEYFTEQRQTSKFSAGRILYVGDREKVDIVPAAAQGMKTALINRKSKPVESQANFVIPNIYSLEEVIESIESVGSRDA